MITNLTVRPIQNGYIVMIERVTEVVDEKNGKYNKYSSEEFVFEKLSKLQKALKLFSTDLALADDVVPF